MHSPPVNIKLKRAVGVLEVRWDDGPPGRCAARTLRCECRCAACVDEHTGVRTLDTKTINNDITIQDMQLVGNYAVRFDFSDGHDTGIYSWDLLHRLSTHEQTSSADPPL